MATLDGYSGAERDAFALLRATLTANNLGGLAGKLEEFITAGYAPDLVSQLLTETPEYATRFSANAARKAAGLPVLSPAEYLSTESAYRSVMSTAGLPVGFYDQPSDFTAWLANDTSPTEIKSRVDTATELVTNGDSQTLAYFRQYYTTGDLVAYALDQKRAAPLVAKQLATAKVGAAARRGGYGLQEYDAASLVDRGFDANQVQQGYGSIRDTLADTAKLNELYGGGPTKRDLETDWFSSTTEGAKKVRTLASKERAAFSGSGGQSKTSLTKSGAGQY